MDSAGGAEAPKAPPLDPPLLTPAAQEYFPGLCQIGYQDLAQANRTGVEFLYVWAKVIILTASY